jgi:solute carrier family 44 protein 1 (choline transporter-like protein)
MVRRHSPPPPPAHPLTSCIVDLLINVLINAYYSRDKERKLGCPIARSTGRLIRYHLGSVAFGSFIIALVMLARLILAYIQRK